MHRRASALDKRPDRHRLRLSLLLGNSYLLVISKHYIRGASLLRSLLLLISTTSSSSSSSEVRYDRRWVPYTRGEASRFRWGVQFRHIIPSCPNSFEECHHHSAKGN